VLSTDKYVKSADLSGKSNIMKNFVFRYKAEKSLFNKCVILKDWHCLP
jgi:hypothetical protein